VDLLGEHLTERPAEHREVLAEDEHLAAVDGAPTGDDPVGVGALEQPAVVGTVAGEHVELVERPRVEEEVDPLAGEHLALGVLPLDRALRAGVERLLLALGQLRQPLAHGMLGHEARRYRWPRNGRKLDRAVKFVATSEERLHRMATLLLRRRWREPMHELVIRGGTVVDGTGAPALTADVAVDDGRITAVGKVDERGARELDADGLVVAPGWVDIHTHYDGQVTWDPEITPSSWHGVTTVVMGNCGVGFAPVRPGAESFLIELMEGVEDIPGTALHEGIAWDWESFPEYLDALDATPRAIDVAAQVPHAALRAYVMGDRAHEREADADEVAEMSKLAEEGLRAGACGISTSRTILHSSQHGLVPGTDAPPEELLALGDAIGRAGHGVFQLVSDHQGGAGDRAWLVDLVERTGATATYALAQAPYAPDAWRDALAAAVDDRAAGRRIIPQVACRPTGMLFGLQSSLHPFFTHPTYRDVADLPLAERVARLSQPEVRAALLADEPGTRNPIALGLMQRWEQIFPLGDPPEYEPPREASIAGVAEREGRTAQEVALDWLLERGGTSFLFAPLASYVHHDHEALREMITDPNTVLGLSDGGAHCGLICDVSMPTYLLTHWVNGRHRGPRLGLEQAVSLQTSRTASAYGFTDRGVVAEGKRADLNLIDLDAMHLRAPEMVFDLPAGGRRLIQRADGYVATLVAGQVTAEHGEPTGARPGRLVRF
jgi:N-acyl-D-aspartate/D-glutamate deacylase